MPEIHLTVIDDCGNHTQQVYRLEAELNTLDQIEQAVEKFKQQALPDVEKVLLTQAQEQFVEQEKKTNTGEQW